MTLTLNFARDQAESRYSYCTYSDSGLIRNVACYIIAEMVIFTGGRKFELPIYNINTQIISAWLTTD